MEIPKGSFSYYEGTYEEFLIDAKDAQSHLIKCVVAPVTRRLADDLSLRGININLTWVHTVDNSGVRHAMKAHGKSSEQLRGQTPLVLSDLLSIPLIVQSYDTIETFKNKRNQDTILYTKKTQSGDTYFYVEEVRQGRRELAASTLYKRKKENSPTLIE